MGYFYFIIWSHCQWQKLFFASTNGLKSELIWRLPATCPHCRQPTSWSRQELPGFCTASGAEAWRVADFRRASQSEGIEERRSAQARYPRFGRRCEDPGAVGSAKSILVAISKKLLYFNFSSIINIIMGTVSRFSDSLGLVFILITGGMVEAVLG